jgi:putative membrane protein
VTASTPSERSSPAPQPPFDVGLQPERSALAWRRTALALTVGPLIMARLLAPALGGWAVAIAVGGVAFGLFLLLASAARYRRVHEALTGRPAPGRRRGFVLHEALPGGRLLLATALVPALGGAVTLAVVLRHL